jgi:hypothetical protein
MTMHCVAAPAGNASPPVPAISGGITTPLSVLAALASRAWQNLRQQHHQKLELRALRHVQPQVLKDLGLCVSASPRHRRAWAGVDYWLP